ncbi:hypothetical protein ACFW04_010749 [Cataglyphis niger]
MSGTVNSKSLNSSNFFPFQVLNNQRSNNSISLADWLIIIHFKTYIYDYQFTAANVYLQMDSCGLNMAIMGSMERITMSLL